MMKFTDYPRDLQRIVELTPDGWGEPSCNAILLSAKGKQVFYDQDKHAAFEFTRTEYNQCRAQWLAEMAEESELPVEFCADAVAAMNEPVKPYVRRGDRVDCNCDQLRDALEDMLSGWRYIREVHGDLSGVGWDRAEDKARKALEQTK